MNLSTLRRAEVLLDGLSVGNEQAHTPEFIRQVRDGARLLAESEQDLLTAYAWHIQGQSACPRDGKTLVLRFVAYAEAEQDAWNMGADRFTERHGFPPEDLWRVRDALLLAAAETVETMT